MRYLLIIVLFCICSGAVAAQEDEFAIKLLVLAPNVQYQRSNTAEWLFVGSENIAGTGDRIRTAHSGRARLVLFGDGSRIDLEPDTTLQIDRAETDENNFDIRLAMENGETRHRVVRADGTYEVAVEGGTLSSEGGTEFIVTQREDEPTSILVLQGTVTITNNDEESVSIEAGQGTRIAPDGTLTDVVLADSFEVLTTLIDGCPGSITPTENRRLPVYLAPTLESLPVGAINPLGIDVISGSTIDRSWFRVPYAGSGGWIAADMLDFVDTTGCAAFRVYADDATEDPQSYNADADLLAWEYCTNNRMPPESWEPYSLRGGQTLYELAQRTSSTVEQIALINCIADVRAVAPGQSIYLPPVP